jgi:predicted amidophosphoribosyltransferase
VKNVDVDEEKCGLCGTAASPGAAYCVACGEALKRKTSPIERQPQGPPTKVVTIALTEPVLKRINDMRGGVSLSDYIAELVTEHLKKQKPIPPEVVDRALID